MQYKYIECLVYLTNSKFYKNYYSLQLIVAILAICYVYFWHLIINIKIFNIAG